MLHAGHQRKIYLTSKDEPQKSFDPWQFDLIAVQHLGLVNLGWLARNVTNRDVPAREKSSKKPRATHPTGQSAPPVTPYFSPGTHSLICPHGRPGPKREA